MDRDWKLYGDVIKGARKQLRLTQEKFGEAAGISRSSVQSLEAGRVPEGEGSPSVLRTERFLGFPPGTAAAIADGSTAPPIRELRVAIPEADDPDWLAQLPTLVREELRHGRVLDADVIGVGGGLKLVVMAVSDEADLTPEQLRETQATWQRSRRDLWRLEGEDAR